MVIIIIFFLLLFFHPQSWAQKAQKKWMETSEEVNIQIFAFSVFQEKV